MPFAKMLIPIVFYGSYVSRFFNISERLQQKLHLQRIKNTLKTGNFVLTSLLLSKDGKIKI